MVLVLAAVAVLAASPGRADAAPLQCRRQGGEYRSWCADVTGLSGSNSLPLQRGPNYGDGTVPGTAYHNGDRLALGCWTTGPEDAGGHGDTYWFSVFDPNDPSIEGYVNDYNLTTGSPGQWMSVVERCANTPPVTSKPYRCRKSGGEYRSWCANVTGLAYNASLALRTDPDYDHGTVPDTAYHNDEPLALGCWTTGPEDAGGHGDTYWFSVFDPNDPSLEGYVNDYNLTTGSPADWKPDVNVCVSTPTTPTPTAGKYGINWANINYRGAVIATGKFNSGLHAFHETEDPNTKLGFNSFNLKDLKCGDGWGVGVSWQIGGGPVHDQRYTDCSGAPALHVLEPGGATHNLQSLTWGLYVWDPSPATDWGYSVERHDQYGSLSVQPNDRYFDFTTVYHDPVAGHDGQITLSVEPTQYLRRSHSQNFQAMWQDITQRTPLPANLTQDQVTSMYKQFWCHAFYSVHRIKGSGYYGGLTWDFESSRPNIPWSQVDTPPLPWDSTGNSTPYPNNHSCNW
ncbi:DUF2599 domain-containing protein [Streptomyces guryensis]|uniref:DUF2599 domain-containing protein n=1 Tax=Streptomyces guryensis TaxID=2886947 RepID=A0A9Q3ZA39_9ACTN|nr:DUF2599 domain-containing protein [Streptomyces guryensis]MCD9880946.1 DUF2599 domain-containing protein [Streptomyces guryensis]